MPLSFGPFDYRSSFAERRELFIDAFPEHTDDSVSSEEHYMWKFHSFPAETASYEYGCWDESGRLVGYYAAVPYPYVINGETMTCGMVCDVMTHSSMRGRGVFTKLGRYATSAMAEEGLHFTSGYPIRPEVIPGHLKVGWQIAFPFKLWVRPLRSNSVLSKKRLGMLAPFVNPWLGIYNRALSFSLSKTEIECETFEPSQLDELSGYEEFISQWSAGRSHVLVKSVPFLKWRLSAPTRRYKLVVARENDRIIAWATTALTDVRGVPALGVLDLMTLPGRSDALRVMQKELGTLARQEGAEIILGMFSDISASELGLWRAGYLRTPVTFKLITKKLADVIEEDVFNRPENWRLTWLDSDNL